MAKAKLLKWEEAAERFAEVFRSAGVTSEAPNTLKGWSAFKEFCTVPVDRTSEGFIFHSGYGVNFPPPDHERVTDYSCYEVAFTRYWSETGNEEASSVLAECSFKIADHPVLRKHEWVDVEIDAGKDPTLQTARLAKFVKKVEEINELWSVLRDATAQSMESYLGPQ
jgi:hypothetical protein